MRIAIEGMDGSGKTTVAKYISNYFNYKYITKPFDFLFKDFGFTESQIKDIEWCLYKTQDEALISLFYGMGLLYGTRVIKDEDVVYDRHFVSNYYWHGNEETELLHDLFINYSGKPDLTLLLRASTKTRMELIYKRDSHDRDLSNISMYDDGYDKMITFLENKKFNYEIIDTDNKTIDEVIESCVNTKENKKKDYVRCLKK